MADDLKDIYKKKIGNATYEELSQFIKTEMSEGLRPIREEIREMKKFDSASNDPEARDRFVALTPKSGLVQELHELTGMYLAAGYSLTKAFDEAKMLLVKLKSNSPL